MSSRHDLFCFGTLLKCNNVTLVLEGMSSNRLQTLVTLLFLHLLRTSNFSVQHCTAHTSELTTKPKLVSVAKWFLRSVNKSTLWIKQNSISTLFGKAVICNLCGKKQLHFDVKPSKESDKIESQVSFSTVCKTWTLFLSVGCLSNSFVSRNKNFDKIGLPA